MTWHTEIKKHYETVWNTKGELCPFEEGPIHQLPNDFSVLRFPPHGDRTLWTYATCCMSQPDDQRPIELHIFSQKKSDPIVELLFAAAHFHHTGARLDLGHSVNFGRPWQDGSDCQHGFLSLPYLDGPLLENLNLLSSVIKFYWLIPISASEVDFKKRCGVEMLEEQFDQAAFDYADPYRASVV